MKKNKKEPMVPQSNLKTTAQQGSYELDDDSCASVAGGLPAAAIRGYRCKCRKCGVMFLSPHATDVCEFCAKFIRRK